MRVVVHITLPSWGYSEISVCFLRTWTLVYRKLKSWRSPRSVSLPKRVQIKNSIPNAAPKCENKHSCVTSNVGMCFFPFRLWISRLPQRSRSLVVLTNTKYSFCNFLCAVIRAIRCCSTAALLVQSGWFPNGIRWKVSKLLPLRVIIRLFQKFCPFLWIYFKL